MVVTLDGTADMTVHLDTDGETWVDPPEYWDQIVWPAYLVAHQQMFVDHNVETGALDRSHPFAKDLVMLEARPNSIPTDTMRRFVDQSLEAVWACLQLP